MGEERFGEFVLVRRHADGHVAELVLDRPKAMNAVSTAMAGSLAEACAALAADRDVRVIVVTSTHERAFCVGADLKERNSLTDAELVRQRPVARGAYTGVLELPDADDRRGARLRPRRRLRTRPVLRPDRGGPYGCGGAAGGVGGRDPGRRRYAAAAPPGGRGACGRADLHRAAGGGGGGGGAGAGGPLVDAGQDREEALALAARIAANSPVGLRAAKRALRLGQGLDLRAGLEVEDAAWRVGGVLGGPGGGGRGVQREADAGVAGGVGEPRRRKMGAIPAHSPRWPALAPRGRGAATCAAPPRGRAPAPTGPAPGRQPKVHDTCSPHQCPAMS